MPFHAFILVTFSAHILFITRASRRLNATTGLILKNTLLTTRLQAFKPAIRFTFMRVLAQERSIPHGIQAIHYDGLEIISRDIDIYALGYGRLSRH